MADSGLRKAGTILLLVGAILGAVGSVFMLGFAGLFQIIGESEDAGELGDLGADMLSAIYAVLAVLLAIGCAFGFAAHGRARRGDLHGAWVFGLVAALLPPLQVVPFLGALFCLLCPEHDAQKAGRATS